MPDHQLPEVSLANEEWDFSGCPKEEIFDCWVYEFAREYFRRHKEVPEACHFFFPIPNGFPHIPYLCNSRVNPTENDVNLVNEWLDQKPDIQLKSPLSEVREEDQPDIRLKIDWRFSNTVLLRCMKRILNEKRPSSPVQRKGRQEDGVLETDLKCLGAFRLVKIAGLKTLEAAKYTQKILGEELYVESTNWSEAVSRVGSVIENFASRIDGFSH